MTRFVYINGQYVPYGDAQVHIEDRGFQWGDSVYIVFACHNSHFIDIDMHLQKLVDYAAAIHFQLPFPKEIIPHICRELLHKNHMEDAAFYVQLTRGVAKRVHWFPEEGSHPGMVIVARPFRFNFSANNLDTIRVISSPDIRWGRSSIKTNAALANVLLRQNAFSNGCFESLLLDGDGQITEGASSNVFIFTTKGILQTRPDDGSIVAGVTRMRILELARKNKIPVLEKPFTLEEAKNAAEAFITGATSLIKSITHIDDKMLDNGKPGAITQTIAGHYFNYCRDLTEKNT